MLCMGLLGSDDNDDGQTQRGGFETAEELNKGFKRRVIDEEAGVVIWAVRCNDGYGMTSLPIEQTDLTIDDD